MEDHLMEDHSAAATGLEQEAATLADGARLDGRFRLLHVIGDYAFRGAFKVAYDGKAWSASGPGGFTPKQSLMQTANGISMAATGLNMTHQLRVVFGVGAFGLATGPFFNFNSGAGLFKGSSAGLLECKEATLHVSMAGGVGYLIPKRVTDAINFILGELHINYRINSQGGPESEPIPSTIPR